MKRVLRILVAGVLLTLTFAILAFAAPSAVIGSDMAEECYVAIQDDRKTANLLSITGSGTKSDPFMIATEEDLMLISDFPEYHFKLANDITLTAENWEPLCVLGDPFSGTFDGDGYKISGLTISTTLNSDKKGLFSSNAGIIKNLSVETSATGITGYAKYVGVIAGYNSGTIQNCVSTGNISSIFSDNYERNFGGLIGYNYSTGVLSACRSDVLIELDKNASTTIVGSDPIYYRNVGGLAGVNEGLIEICHFDGIINLGGYSSSVTKGSGLYGGHYYHGPGYYIAGAIAARNSGSIKNCLGITTIDDIDGFASTRCSGLVYSNTGSIINCYAVVSGDDLSYGITNGGTVTNSFYDKTISEKNDTGYGTPKSTAAMKMALTYTNAGWDFDKIWTISEDINEGYPCLQWIYGLTHGVTISLGEKANASNVRYYEFDGNQLGINGNTLSVATEKDMLIEVTEKESADSIYAVSTKYYFVDFETLTYYEVEGLGSYMNNIDEPTIRIHDPLSIRFKSNVSTLSKGETEDFEITEYGFITAVQSVIEESGTQLNLDFPKYAKGVAYNKSESIDLIFDSRDDDWCVFTGILTNIPEKNYTTVVTTKTYTKVTVDGNEFVVYGEPVSASMYDIAKSLINTDLSDEQRTEVERIIESVNNRELGIFGGDLFN